jgi:hypothetical protein
MQLEVVLLRKVIVLTFLLAVVGCSKQDMLQKFAPPADQAVARHYIDSLRQRRYEEIEQAADPSIAGPAVHGTLVKMAQLIPQGEPTSVTLIGARQMTAGDFSTVNLSYEYNFSGSWLLTNVSIKKQGGRSTIVGLNVYPQPSSLEQQNKFTLTGKSPLQYFVLTMVAFLPLFTLYALAICIRTKFKGRKWPWVLFVLVGVGKVIVNWTTGQWGIQPLAVQLFSASAFAPLYGQWTIAISIPFGAVVFLLRRRQLAVT